MPDHVLRDVYRYELLAVVHGKRVTDKIRCDHRSPAPGLHDLLLTRLIQIVHFLLKLEMDERTFF